MVVDLFGGVLAVLLGRFCVEVVFLRRCARSNRGAMSPVVETLGHHLLMKTLTADLCSISAVLHTNSRPHSTQGHQHSSSYHSDLLHRQVALWESKVGKRECVCIRDGNLESCEGSYTSKVSHRKLGPRRRCYLER